MEIIHDSLICRPTNETCWLGAWTIDPIAPCRLYCLQWSAWIFWALFILPALARHKIQLAEVTVAILTAIWTGCQHLRISWGQQYSSRRSQERCRHHQASGPSGGPNIEAQITKHWRRTQCPCWTSKSNCYTYQSVPFKQNSCAASSLNAVKWTYHHFSTWAWSPRLAPYFWLSKPREVAIVAALPMCVLI